MGSRGSEGHGWRTERRLRQERRKARREAAVHYMKYGAAFGGAVGFYFGAENPKIAVLCIGGGALVGGMLGLSYGYLGS